MESRQAEIDFTKEQLANLRLRLDSMKATDDIKKDENDLVTNEISDDNTILKENQTDALKERVIQLEAQLKSVQLKVISMPNFIFLPILFIRLINILIYLECQRGLCSGPDWFKFERFRPPTRYCPYFPDIITSVLSSLMYLFMGWAD